VGEKAGEGEVEDARAGGEGEGGGTQGRRSPGAARLVKVDAARVPGALAKQAPLRGRILAHVAVEAHLVRGPPARGPAVAATTTAAAAAATAAAAHTTKVTVAATAAATRGAAKAAAAAPTATCTEARGGRGGEVKWEKGEKAG